MFENNVLIAFGLTLFAGLATGIGSGLAFFAKRTNTRFLSVALGFSVWGIREVNIETDLIGKYVARFLRNDGHVKPQGVTMEALAKHGFL